MQNMLRYFTNNVPTHEQRQLAHYVVARKKHRFCLEMLDPIAKEITDRKQKQIFYSLYESSNRLTNNTPYESIRQSYASSGRDLQRIRESFKTETKYGLQNVLEKLHKSSFTAIRSIETRPHLDFRLELDCGHAKNINPRIEAVLYLDEDGHIYREKNPNTIRKTLSLPVPLDWYKQVALIGKASVDNKIIKTVRPIGEYRDVQGFACTWYKKGLKANEWSEESGYVGKFLDTVKTCKSRMHIPTVVKRQASSDFTDELLSVDDF